MVLGNGSNLLVADEGYDGVILSLHRMNKEAGQVGELHQIRILPADASETEKVAVLEEYGVKQCISTVKAYVSAGAGVMLSTLAARIADQGLAGFEFAGGIPGTLGGAVTIEQVRSICFQRKNYICLIDTVLCRNRGLSLCQRYLLLNRETGRRSRRRCRN